MDDIAVLVVDDSALMRNLVSRMIDAVPGMTVVGKAMDGHGFGKVGTLQSRCYHFRP